VLRCSSEEHIPPSHLNRCPFLQFRNYLGEILIKRVGHATNSKARKSRVIPGFHVDRHRSHARQVRFILLLFENIHNTLYSIEIAWIPGYLTEVGEFQPERSYFRDEHGIARFLRDSINSGFEVPTHDRHAIRYVERLVKHITQLRGSLEERGVCTFSQNMSEKQAPKYRIVVSNMFTLVKHRC
jgi:hypothetical protein